MEVLEAVYRISGTERVRDRAAAILLEQTIETPRSVAERYAFVRDHMMGSVGRVDLDPSNGALATLSLPVVTASIDPAQFLNVLFGNSSLHADVRLEDFTPPPSITTMLRGPRFGIPGLRERTRVFDRPLTCSALKPVGASLEDMAGICRDMAEGGLDLIKDDHYLADHPFAPFDERVRVCQDVVEEVAARTGHHAVYIPNLSGTPDDVKRQAFVAQRSGVGAVMAAPMLLGMPVFHQLCVSELEVPVVAHPSFAGVQAIRPATLYGKLFRLFGADAVIFANYGGRFSFSAATCEEIARTLRTPWLDLLPAFPTPAGGMDAGRAAELVHFFGTDSILLVGGSLLEAGDDLREKSARFTESVRDAALAAKRPR
jgi:ribulose-bisphosphate carboxylase large chain